MDTDRLGSVHGIAVETRKGKIGEHEVVRAASVTQLSAEVSTLVVIDQLEDPDVKREVLQIIKRLNEKQLEVIDRSEARYDRLNEASIRLQKISLFIAAVLFILVLIAFTWCALNHVPAACLWSFAIFFLGSAGFFALRKFRRKD